MKITFLTLTFVCFVVSFSTAQLVSPDQFLGYQLGERFTPHHRVVSYFEHVAKHSDRVELKQYGETYEKRPLLLAFVGTANNVAKKESIRQDNLKRAGLLSGNPENKIAITWLSYNVHGNEASSTEAAMRTLYELVKPGSTYSQYLENNLVIMDPCINPDGRDRYVNFYTQFGQMPYQPDPQSLEHLEPWPGGRQNHYLFDLNRDWAWLTQIESRKRLVEYNQWLPHIHVDFHEQGYNSPYYFAPAAEPFHELITDWQREFQVTIGKNHARYFDENNWFYFTKQRFDLLYPSYGDTYPTYNGAIGMTYEQAGHGRAGLGIIKAEGDTLTLIDRLLHHHTTGISTIEITSRHADRVLQEFEQFFNTPVKSAYKSFVVKNTNQDKIDALKKWLDLHQIQYGTTSAKLVSGFQYNTAKNQNYTIQNSDLVITVNQPKGTLASILFEPKTKLSDSLTYDITAWSAPYVFGLDAVASTSVLPVNKEEGFNSKYVNQTAPESSYAFFFKWDAFEDAKFLADLLKNDIKVRYNEVAIRINGKTFAAGTLIVTKSDNKKLGNTFEQTITDKAAAFSRSFEVVKTGFMESGPDLGSSDIKLIKQPKVALIAGDGTYVTEVGATWYYLEQELAFPFSMIHTAHISRTDLTEYNVIIMQDGWYGSHIGDSQLKKLNEWVKNGGKLILVQNAIEKFVGTDFSGIEYFNSDSEKTLSESKQKNLEEERKLMAYGDQERQYAKSMIPGAIFKVTLDQTHPLAYGYGKEYFTLKTSDNRYAYLGGENVGVIKSKDDHMSGFAGQYVREKMPQSLVFGVERQDRGQLVYFVDNPLFRAFWYSGKLMFANALFMVGNE